MREIKFVSFFLVFSLAVSIDAFAQDSSGSFIDKVENVIEVRKSFDTKSESTKPALLSYSKESGEDAVYKIDIAVLYKGFTFKNGGISPAVQFEYTSSGKTKEESFKGSLIGYWDAGNKTSYIKIEPAVSYLRDFLTGIDTYEGRIMLFPRSPGFVIPIQDITSVKMKYGKDEKWIAGFNPAIGFAYVDKLGNKTSNDLKKAYSIVSANISLKKQYILFDLYGKYEKEYDEDANSSYKYGGSFTFYFDAKERSSLNIKAENENKDVNKSKDKITTVTVGFGFKL